jgi:zinc and cadmium transporter
VAAHEIPQEIGDFGLLLSKGLRRKKVLLINVLSSLATVVAAVITYTLGSEDKLPIGLLLGLSAGFLLYIALSDIIPTIHAKTDASKLIQMQTVLLLVGVAVVGLAVHLSHQYVDAGH